ncbi:MAG: transporter [Paracoccaceae bacterium]
MKRWPGFRECDAFFSAMRLAGLVVAMLGVSAPVALAQMGDGPRAYQLLPKDTRAISQFYIGTRGNLAPSEGSVIQGANIDVDLGLTQFSQTFGLNGNQAGVLAFIPYGRASGSLGLGGATVSGSDNGLGDLTLGFVYGFLNAPNLSREAYVKHDPGLTMSALARLTLPTGSYSANRNLNLGGNRWVLELGLPVSYYLGRSFLDPSLMTFEIQPKVTIFGDNTDAIGATQVLSQDAIYSVEAHVTRNFGQAFWASLDAFYAYGGETQNDGVAANNRQRSLSLGVTGNLTLSEAMSIKLTYGEVVSGNAAGADGRAVRAQFLYLF